MDLTCPKCWKPIDATEMGEPCAACQTPIPTHPHPWDRIVAAVSPLGVLTEPWEKAPVGLITPAVEGLTVYQGAVGLTLLYGGLVAVNTSGAVASFALFDGQNQPTSMVDEVQVLANSTVRDPVSSIVGDRVRTGQLLVGNIVGACSLILRVRQL